MSHVTPVSGVLHRLRYRLYGLAFVVILVLFGMLTVALYNKTFTPVVTVTLDADRAGLQLLPHSDVKIRGLIVGEVRKISATPTGASLQLALDPDKVDEIPGNVSARLLPKTLFGEKYVDLVVPPHPVSHIAAGAVIPQDRSAAAVEVGQVLDDLTPVLRTLQPEKLNATLNALATALQGRGAQLGRSMEVTDAYLRKINPKLPTIEHDIAALADVAQVYDNAAPDLLQTLRNVIFTSRTIVQEKDAIATLLAAATTTADTANGFLTTNGNRIIGVNIADKQVLALLARYSPEVPCVFAGLVKLQPRLEDAFGGRQPGLHITFEIAKPRPAYQPGLDTPQYADQRGPRCYGLPNPPVPFPTHQILDGTQGDYGGNRAMSAALTGTGTAYDGAAADRAVIDTVAAPVLGTPASQVPDIADLLVGPMAQGSVVTVR